MPTALGANLYRIAQEAITNAAKHAEATRVVLRLTMREAQAAAGDSAAREIELVVDDDGRVSERDHTVKGGMGFLGMRERVATLSGQLTFEAGRKAGSSLRVVIPVLPNEAAIDVQSLPA